MHFLDLVFGMAARGAPFFEDGWGDRELCLSMDPAALARRPIPAIGVHLSRPRAAYGGLLQEGSFDSPEDRLPRCGRRARIRMLLPSRRKVRGVAVHLAASGDQGFAVRLRFAAPLLDDGIGAIVLENPYYGSRRPQRQQGPAVRSVSDLHLMGAATFQEGRALLRWIREEREVPLAGVTGYSMGGQLAAMVGASMPFPVAIVPIAAPCSPDSVLRHGVLRKLAHVAALATDGETVEAAREALCVHLSRFSVTALPAPVVPEAAIVVGTRSDGVVPPSEMRCIAEHWGAELRWMEAGHVSAVLRHQGEMREAIRDAFLQLEEALRVATPSSGRALGRARESAPPARGVPAFAAMRAPPADPAGGRRS